MSAWHFCSWGEEKLLVKHHIYPTDKNIFKGNICFLQCIITQKLQTLALFCFFNASSHRSFTHLLLFSTRNKLDLLFTNYLVQSGTNAYKARNHIMFTISLHCSQFRNYDDVIKWKLFPRYWPLVRGIHQSPVNSPHKVQWRGALNKQSWGWWFETPSHSSWRYCNDHFIFLSIYLVASIKWHDTF